MGSPAEVLTPDVIASVYGCRVLVDAHPVSGVPRVTLPGREQ
jgi:iron complex transport system ATP-binding protein